MTKPLLFLDVDGPINPYMAMKNPPEGYTKHLLKPKGFSNGLAVLLNHGHGEQLQALPYDLVWATTWEHEANEWIAPHIGVPELPVIEFGPSPSRSDSRLHWKTAKLIEYADSRPFVWVDDECTTHDWNAIQKEHGSHGDILLASPSLGLTSGDFWKLRRKAQEVEQACARNFR